MLAIKLQTHLKAFLGSGGPAIYLTVMDKSGKVIAEVKNPEKKPDFTLELQQMVAELATHYPRDGFQKALYEDGMGLVSVIRINGSLLLLAISGKDSPVGAVTHGLTRLATQLAQSGEVSANG
jgi:hypothetical protein